MKVRAGAALLALLGPLGFCFSASAGGLPPILTSSSNTVPACVTPGRLNAFLSSRNSRLKKKYDKIAVDYMRHGEELGLRWDYGFFQMLVETDTLRYTGDVKPRQNNFAGLGATGGGVRGESFSTVSKGVRAHLQHVLMYAGTHVENPVAERTRKVQEWGVLNKWRRRLKKPVTFKHLTQQWSPGDRGYSRDIAAIAKRFFDKFCKRADPQPGLVAEARSGRKKSDRQQAAAKPKTETVTAARTVPSAPSAKKDSGGTSAQPTAGGDAASGGAGRFSSPNSAIKDVAVLNPPKKEQVAPAASPSSDASPSAGATATGKPDAGTAAAPVGTAASKKKKAGNCKVWTASYGGSKALIIKAVAKGITNYTVLDVKKGQEKRQASAYISAYAKGGTTVGEFPSPEKALKQAFELCPEG